MKNTKNQTETPIEQKSPVMIITPYRYDFRGRTETFLRPTLTIPDQTLTVIEILQRFGTGQPLEGLKAEIYNGDEEIPDVQKMDLEEIAELKLQLDKNIKELKSRIHKAEIEKQIQAKEKETLENPTLIETK